MHKLGFFCKQCTTSQKLFLTPYKLLYFVLLSKNMSSLGNVQPTTDRKDRGGRAATGLSLESRIFFSILSIEQCAFSRPLKFKPHSSLFTTFTEPHTHIKAQNSEQNSIEEKRKTTVLKDYRVPLINGHARAAHQSESSIAA